MIIVVESMLMPGSSSAGRHEAMDMIFKHGIEPATILDVGPGAGQWYDLLHPWFPKAHFGAVEIFEPYIKRYELLKKYDMVWNGDVRHYAMSRMAVEHGEVWGFTKLDLVVFGDVIEHMEKIDAIKVVNKLLHKHALISIPIGECPQDPTAENSYEEHLATWETEEILDVFPVIDYYAYKFPPPHFGRGVFLLEKK